ncbi:MAG TPA: DUF4345 family protein [Caulobacteraceae bacterium]
MGLAIILAVIACCIGGAMGGYALARPHEAARLVGLTPDPEKPHALAEVRATYGGLVVLSHAAVAGALGYAPYAGAWMALTLSAAWTGAALARGWSMMKDDSDTSFNVRATVFEFLMGVTLALPFWSLSGSGGGGGVLV